jgi:hypothetical protein
MVEWTKYYRVFQSFLRPSQPETLDPPVRGDAAICAEEGNCGRHVGDAYSAAGEWHWPLFFLVEIFRWSGQEFQVPV